MRRQSIQVVAKKASNGKWKITNDLGLTTLYAPPTYEDVVRSSEEDPPPAYDTLPRHGESSPLNDNIVNENNVTVVCVHNGDGDNLSITCTHVQQYRECSGSENDDTSERDMACSDSLSAMSESGSASGSSIDKKKGSDKSPVRSCSSKSSLPMDNICDKIEYLDSEGETEIM